MPEHFEHVDNYGDRFTIGEGGDRIYPQTTDRNGEQVGPEVSMDRDAARKLRDWLNLWLRDDAEPEPEPEPASDTLLAAIVAVAYTLGRAQSLDQ